MRRMRQHVNPLTAHHLKSCGERLQLPADRPVEVELGCADGQFLFQRARAAPEGHYVGVEIRREWIEQISRAGVGNVTGVVANLLVANDLFAPGSIRRFHINFPDPLFKRSQHPRRWLTADVVRALAVALEPGGELFFQSDIFEPALDALGALEADDQLQNVHGEWRFAPINPFGARSRREQWCEAHEVRIWRLLFRKR
jgi:tRNA (guanine-N7-)-methyltransferase